MPPRKKEPVPADDLCPEHFPPSWADLPEHYESVACEHGTYVRPGTERAETES